MTPRVKRLVSELAQLSGPERNTVMLHLKALGATTQGTDQRKRVEHEIVVGEIDLEADWLLDGVRRHLVKTGRLKPKHGSGHVKVVLSKAVKYGSNSQIARGQLLNMLKRESGYSRHLALGLLAAKALDKHLKSRRIDVNLQTMVNAIHLTPLAMEESFPGYAQAGLLDMIVTQSSGNR